MINLYSAIKSSPQFKKLEVNELLFAEYTCMKEETKLGIWSNNNYFAFISSGKKMWRTLQHAYEVAEGDILFVKKGANITHQFFEDEFCAIFIFIPDNFIQSFLQKYAGLKSSRQKHISSQDAVLQLQNDALLSTYYQSIRSYLHLPVPPDKQLLLHKFEELLLCLFSNNKNRELLDYFVFTGQSRLFHMRTIMEQNFAYQLRLEEFAQLCHMSLSAFKKNFRELYGCTPALWLKERRLDMAAEQLTIKQSDIAQIAFECGFKDTSHFIRLFKERSGFTPLQFRKKREAAAVQVV